MRWDDSVFLSEPLVEQGVKGSVDNDQDSGFVCVSSERWERSLVVDVEGRGGIRSVATAATTSTTTTATSTALAATVTTTAATTARGTLKASVDLNVDLLLLLGLRLRSIFRLIRTMLDSCDP